MILCADCYQKKDLPEGKGRAWFWGKRSIDKWGKGLPEVTKCKDCGKASTMMLYSDWDEKVTGPGQWVEVGKYQCKPPVPFIKTDREKNLELSEKIRRYRLNRG